MGPRDEAEELAIHLLDAIWGEHTAVSYDQVMECLHVADALVAAGYTKTEDGAATPPADPHYQPVGAGEDLADESANGAGNTAAAPSSSTGPGPAAIGGQPGPVRQPRVFELYRHRDVTGKSGVGTVAWGIQWPDGTVALRWVTAHPSTVHWDSIDAILAVHGHSGATEIQWLDGGGE